jgi:hypothetical protein
VSSADQPSHRASRRDVLGAAAGVAVVQLAAGAARAAAGTCCPVVELRQYTLHPGTRERFFALFEREFVETQEAVGIRVIGQFRDLDDPDRFVWLRGFPDMPHRAEALGAFYGGAHWKALRNEANASINDSDNVLLLRPARPDSGFDASRLHRAPPGHAFHSHGVVVANIHYLDADMVATFADFFQSRMRPQLAELHIPLLSEFASAPDPNNFPKLPIREKDHVFIWFAGFPSEAEADAQLKRIRANQSWREGAGDPILHQLERKPEVLRLRPADRSALRA